jgi:hypothetical protein
MALDLGIQVGMRQPEGNAFYDTPLSPNVTLTASPGFLGGTGFAPELSVSARRDITRSPPPGWAGVIEVGYYDQLERLGTAGAIGMTYSGEQKARKKPLRMWAAAGVGLGYSSDVASEYALNTWTFHPITIECARLHYSTSATQSIVAEFAVEQQYVERYFDKLSGSHVLSLSFGYRIRIADLF